MIVVKCVHNLGVTAMARPSNEGFDFEWIFDVVQLDFKRGPTILPLGDYRGGRVILSLSIFKGGFGVPIFGNGNRNGGCYFEAFCNCYL